jgi:hypothetical protein
MQDTEMTQDFRMAMTQLCLQRLEPEDVKLGITTGGSLAARRNASHRREQTDIYHRQNHPPQRSRDVTLVMPMA